MYLAYVSDSLLAYNVGDQGIQGCVLKQENCTSCNLYSKGVPPGGCICVYYPIILRKIVINHIFGWNQKKIVPNIDIIP